jgi:hypothetical protein
VIPQPTPQQDAIVVDRIPLRIDKAALFERLRPAPDMMEELERLAAEAQARARPRALYKLSTVEHRGPSRVLLDGVGFRSRVLRVNLEDPHRAFPYVATCGVELSGWCEAQKGLLQQFWAEAIAEVALQAASESVRREVTTRFKTGPLSTMNPGSLADWPLEEQSRLFQLLGDVEKQIGVRLIESLMMVPVKSVSGILFETEASFQSCQLCPRERCRARRAPYEPGLMQSRYGRDSRR